MKREISRCACGKRKSKWSGVCRACHEAFMNESIRKAKLVVDTGKCPQCGSPLVRNTALAGWWQCGQFGIHPLDPRNPACSYQTFTERM